MAAIDEAYGVFGRYVIRGDLIMRHCSVCMTEERERALVTAPLREISAGLLSE